MDDAAGGEEEQTLEEGVGHEVKDAGRVVSDAAGQEHVAELRDGGVSEDALDVVLDHADGGGEERGCGSDAGDYGEGRWGVVEEDVAAGDHVDTGGDHRCRVDQCGDGGGTFHGVGQPDVEGDLCGLAGGSEDEEEGDCGEEASGEWAGGDAGEDGVEVERAVVGVPGGTWRAGSRSRRCG